MALKTFNLNPEVYKEFSDHCKKQGISMSKKIDNYLRQEVAKIKLPELPDPKTKEVRQSEEHALTKYTH